MFTLTLHLYYFVQIIKESKQMLDKDVNSFFLNDIIASTYGILENYKAAIEYYSKALEIEPESFNTCCSLGISFLKVDKIDEAKKAGADVAGSD